MNNIKRVINGLTIKLMLIIAVKKEERKGLKEIKAVYKTAKTEIEKIKKSDIDNKNNLMDEIGKRTLQQIKNIENLTKFHIQQIIDLIPKTA